MACIEDSLWALLLLLLVVVVVVVIMMRIKMTMVTALMLGVTDVQLAARFTITVIIIFILEDTAVTCQRTCKILLWYTSSLI